MWNYRKSGYNTSNKSQLATKSLLTVTIHVHLNSLRHHVNAVAIQDFTSEATKAAAQVNLFKHSSEQA